MSEYKNMKNRNLLTAGIPTLHRCPVPTLHTHTVIRSGSSSAYHRPIPSTRNPDSFLDQPEWLHPSNWPKTIALLCSWADPDKAVAEQKNFCFQPITTSICCQNCRKWNNRSGNFEIPKKVQRKHHCMPAIWSRNKWRPARIADSVKFDDPWVYTKCKRLLKMYTKQTNKY